MEKCFICCKLLKENIVYLPMMDDYIGQSVSIFKNTFIIKMINSYNFLYYNICDICIDNYLKYYNNIFKYIKNREIGKK